MYEQKVIDLGLEIPQVAAPVANYAPFVVEDGWIYISGQLPLVKGQLAFAGKLGQIGRASCRERVLRLV